MPRLVHFLRKSNSHILLLLWMCNHSLHVKIVIKNPGISRFIDRYNLSNDRISGHDYVVS